MAIWKRLFGKFDDPVREITVDGAPYSVALTPHQFAAAAFATGRGGLRVTHADADDRVLATIAEFRQLCPPVDAYRLEKALIGGRLICERCQTAYKYAAMAFVTNYDGQTCPRCSERHAIILLHSESPVGTSLDLDEPIWNLRAAILAVLMWELEKAGVTKRPRCTCGNEVSSAQSGYYVTGWGPVCEACRGTFAPKKSHDHAAASEDEVRMARAHAAGTLNGFGPHIEAELAKWVTRLAR